MTTGLPRGALERCNTFADKRREDFAFACDRPRRPDACAPFPVLILALFLAGLLMANNLHPQVF
jgi:hypothetical protein